MRIFNLVTAALFFLCLATTEVALASRATNLVMGSGDAGLFLSPSGALGTQTGSFGSLFFEDEYNMFYNPAHINEINDWVIIEKSNYSYTSQDTGQIVGQSAQGGFVLAFLNYRASLFFNRVAGIADYHNASNMRPFDFTLGADLGVPFGLGVSYASYTDGGHTDQDLNLRLGAKVESFEPFGWYKIIGKQETTNPGRRFREWAMGLKYHYGEWKPYAAYRYSHSESNDSVFGIGIGRSSRVSEAVKFHYNVAFWRNRNANESIVPFDIAAEANATSWLVLRGGLGYRFMDREGDSSREVDGTSGRFGATFKFNSVELDTAIGSNVSSTTVAAKDEIDSTADSQVFGVGSDSFFTAASLSYSW